MVQVMTGKDKGSTGKILGVDRTKCRVMVEGVNIQKKHVKPNQKNPQGGVFPMEASIHYSNVLLYSSSEDRGVRVGVKEEKGKKVRVSASTGENI